MSRKEKKPLKPLRTASAESGAQKRAVEEIIKEEQQSATVRTAKERQLKEMAFLREMADIESSERKREFNARLEHIGQVLLTEGEIESIREARREVESKISRARRERLRSHYEGELLGTDEADGEKVCCLPIDNMISALGKEAEFKHAVNDVWTRREGNLARLIKAISTVMVRLRADRRIASIRNRIGAGATRESVRRIVEDEQEAIQQDAFVAPEASKDEVPEWKRYRETLMRICGASSRKTPVPEGGDDAAAEAEKSSSASSPLHAATTSRADVKRVLFLNEETKKAVFYETFAELTESSSSSTDIVDASIPRSFPEHEFFSLFEPSKPLAHKVDDSFCEPYVPKCDRQLRVGAEEESLFRRPRSKPAEDTSDDVIDEEEEAMLSMIALKMPSELTEDDKEALVRDYERKVRIEYRKASAGSIPEMWLKPPAIDPLAFVRVRKARKFETIDPYTEFDPEFILQRIPDDVPSKVLNGDDLAPFSLKEAKRTTTFSQCYKQKNASWHIPDLPALIVRPLEDDILSDDSDSELEYEDPSARVHPSMEAAMTLFDKPPIFDDNDDKLSKASASRARRQEKSTRQEKKEKE